MKGIPSNLTILLSYILEEYLPSFTLMKNGPPPSPLMLEEKKMEPREEEFDSQEYEAPGDYRPFYMGSFH